MEERKTGLDLIGDCPWGTHFCVFYHTKEDLVEILVPYFKAGLENNEFCMWITSQPLELAEAISAMRPAVSGLDARLANGQVEILDYRQWYLQDGGFDAGRVLQGWIHKLEQARSRGFDGLRLSGNTFWLERENWRAFTDYEAQINDVIGRYPMMALCTYSLERCGASEIMDVVANHKFALARQSGRWEQIESAVRKRADELQALNRYLVNVQESERRALARELHDEAGQSLTALKLGIGRLRRELEDQPATANRLAELELIADGVMGDLHRLAMRLRPTSLDRYGLVPALQGYVEMYRRQTGLDAEIVTLGLEVQRLSPEMETVLYRLVQEALTNVARHADATRAGVVVERRGDRVVAIVEDNGSGFDVTAALDGEHLGLIGMRERAEMLGGTLTIESAQDHGTSVFIELPLS